MHSIIKIIIWFLYKSDLSNNVIKILQKYSMHITLNFCYYTTDLHKSTRC